MLSEVMAVVADQGWFDASRPYEKTIFLTHGAAQSMLLSRDGQPECFVKFSDRASLALEAQRSAAAAGHYPRFAPGYVGHASRGGLDVLATRALAFRSVSPEMVQSRRYGTVVQVGLEEYFSCMGSLAQGRSASGDWLGECRAYFGSHPLQEHAEKSLAGLDRTLRALPALRQHGDFVVNNLGIDLGCRLAVFDWEDYGAVDLPGLDLFTLEFSLRGALGQQGGGPVEDVAPSRSTSLDVARMCHAMQLPVQVFEELRLAYAFVFRFLKRNYSPEIRGRVDALLDRLIADTPAAA